MDYCSHQKSPCKPDLVTLSLKHTNMLLKRFGIRIRICCAVGYCNKIITLSL